MFIDLDDKAIEVKRDKEVEELIAWASRRLVDITANVVSHELRRRDEICRKLLDGIIDED